MFTVTLYVHSWLVICAHAFGKKKYENYLHREKAKKTDCRLNNRTNGVRVATSQHIRTGTAKGKMFFPKLFVRNRISNFADFFHYSAVKGKSQV